MSFVPKEWIPAVAVHRSNFRLKKREMIFEEGKEVRGIYFVYEGIVKVHKHWGWHPLPAPRMKLFFVY
jgi:CRP/FNR family transcriptional regulator